MTHVYLNPKIALIGPDGVREISRYIKVLGGTKVLVGRSRNLLKRRL